MRRIKLKAIIYNFRLYYQKIFFSLFKKAILISSFLKKLAMVLLTAGLTFVVFLHLTFHIFFCFMYFVSYVPLFYLA